MPFKGINWKKELPNAIELGKQGKSLREIGEAYGISRQRVKQVFKTHGIDPAEIGVKIQSRLSREQRAQAHFKKWGNKDQILYSEKRRKYLNKKSNARDRGVPFTIAFSEIEWPTHCPMLGIELNFFTEGVQEDSVSFDRIDPTKGYVVGNVHIISWRANRIKNDGTAGEHRLIADYLDRMLKIL